MRETNTDDMEKEQGLVTFKGYQSSNVLGWTKETRLRTSALGRSTGMRKSVYLVHLFGEQGTGAWARSFPAHSARRKIQATRT
ncbi:hypothetical protein DENSPDRAFT_843293 [Dentipellis sp. KUC8613]|nr:hypothetical protein DENSPDRAFT_843293 [Dentipellis sp. KUC8613]